MKKEVAIGFIVREKFGLALDAIRAIYHFTDIPFRLFFVNTGYPEFLLNDIKLFLANKDNVVYINSNHFILPNESLNEIIKLATEPLICVVENDVIVEKNYIKRMIKVIKDYNCDIVSPVIYEGYNQMLHFDPPVSLIYKQDKNYVSNVVRTPRQGYSRVGSTRRIFHIEKHCFLMTQKAAEVLYPFAIDINTREQIDFSIKAFDTGLSIFMATEAHVRYMPPTLIKPYDYEYFRFRWNLERAIFSNDYIEKQWNILDFKKSIKFVEGMNNLLRNKQS